MEKVSVMSLGMGSERKGRAQRFPAPELEMTGRGVEDLRSSSSLVFCCAQHQNCVVLKLIFDL